MRKGILTVTAAVLVVAGFLLGRSLGEDEMEPAFGTQPHALGEGQADITVPAFVPGGKLPPIKTTTVAEAPTETEPDAEESEPVEEPVSSAPEESAPPQKEEKVEAPTPPPTTTPEVTVGESE